MLVFSVVFYLVCEVGGSFAWRKRKEKSDLYWDDPDPATIERVEILKGSAISLYGPGAIAGVINIQTRMPHESASLHAAIENNFGDYTRVNGGLSLSTVGDMGISINAARLETGLLTSGANVKSTQVSGNGYIKLSVMNGFKPPSFFALGHPLTGNPNLKPERSLTSELAARQVFLDEKLKVEASLFYSIYYDQVDFDASTFTHLNRDQFTVMGLDLNFDYAASSTMVFGVNVTFADSKIKGLNRPPRNRPKFLFGGFAEWSPIKDVTLGVQGRYRSRQFASSFVTGPLFLDGFFEVDANLNWKVTKALTVTAKLLNATNTSYEEAVGFPSPGITGRVGVRVNL